MTTNQILNAAADLLSTEGAWTQRTSARDAVGQAVDTLSPRACQWCTVGAIVTVCRKAGESAEETLALLGKIIAQQGPLNPGTLDTIPIIASWNDNSSQTQERVVATLRAAAKINQGN